MVRQEAKVGFRVAKCSSDDGTAPRDRTGTRTELEFHTLFSTFKDDKYSLAKRN